MPSPGRSDEKAELEALAKGEHSDPHHLLGGHPYHPGEQKEVVVRGLSPGCPPGYAFN